MKKLITALLSAALVVLAFPAADTAASGDSVIDMHGTKTYLGLASAWNKTWDADNFTDVTDEDVRCPGNLTVKAGTVGDITMEDGGSRLNVTGGAMDDITMEGGGSRLNVTGGTLKEIRSNGSVEVTDRTVYSVQADGDVKLNKATVRHGVSAGGEFTASGSVSIGDSLEAEDMTIGSGVSLSVSDDIICYNHFLLSGGSIKTDEIDGDDTAKMEIKDFSGTLPVINKMNEIVLDSNNSVTSNGKLVTNRLSIAEKAEFIASSNLEVGTLEGPGTLSIRSGRLLIHDGVTSRPLLVFTDVVSRGKLAFKADRDAVDEDDIQLYDYTLEKEAEGDVDEFRLANDQSSGLTLDHSAVLVEKNRPATVKANVRPSLSRFAEGTKIVWKLHGDTDVFSFSPGSDSRSCVVSCNDGGTSRSRATLVAYLVDSHGDRLSDYRSDSCVVSVGSAGLVCDTSGTYSFGANNVYYYKITTSDTIAPNAVSSNPAAVSVAFSQTLPDGYLYRIENVGTGTAVITTTSAGGASVSFSAVGTGSGIVSDTPYRFSMKTGATYQFKFTTADSGAYSFVAANSGIIKTVSVNYSGNAYYYKIKALAPGCAGVYGQETGKSGVRLCIVTVG